MVTLSLNVPVPARVEAVAEDLLPLLTDFASRRERHTLVCKRLVTDEPPRRVRERLRTTLDGAAPVRARIDGVGAFERPPVGPAPVVFLRVESPGLETLHRRLCEEYPPVEGIEAEAYVPHVTLARGGDVSPADVDALRERPVPAVEWTVDRLHVFDASYDQVAAELSLPP